MEKEERTISIGPAGCRRYVIVAALALLAGCATPTRNPGAYVRFIHPDLLTPPSIEARVALERDGAGEVANVDLHPVLGVGLGLVGVRLTVFPFEGAVGAVDFPFRNEPREEGPAPPPLGSDERSPRR